MKPLGPNSVPGATHADLSIGPKPSLFGLGPEVFPHLLHTHRGPPTPQKKRIIARYHNLQIQNHESHESWNEYGCATQDFIFLLELV